MAHVLLKTAFLSHTDTVPPKQYEAVSTALKTALSTASKAHLAEGFWTSLWEKPKVIVWDKSFPATERGPPPL